MPLTQGTSPNAYAWNEQSNKQRNTSIVISDPFKTNANLANGNNSYTATAEDTIGRTAQDSVSVNLPETATFVYDLNGNLRTNNSRFFDYDDENQLIRITESNSWKSEFSYDGFMRRRVRKEFAWTGSTWLQTNEVRYVYDGMLVVQERDGNNLPQVTYTRGNDLSSSLQGAGGIGGLLARTDHRLFAIGDVNSHAYYHADGNGNVTALVNGSGQVVARYNYDPYGNLLALSGPLAEANTYRFSSKEVHAGSGFYYYGYRFYAPSLQRWLNRDHFADVGSLLLMSAIIIPTIDRSSMGEQSNSAETFRAWVEINCNLYAAVGADPLSLIDPYGLFCLGQFLKGVGGVVGGTAAIFVGAAATSVGVGVIGVVGGAITFQYGLGNLVGAFSHDRETAKKMENAPSDLAGAVGRAIGGEKGQDIGSAVGAATSLTGAIRGGKVLDAAESATGLMDTAMGAADSDSGCD